MTILLFPGRHLLNTAFQDQYLRGILQIPLEQLNFWEGQFPAGADPIDQVIFAITSANQEHSRYNPIPFHGRAIGVDRFARPFEMTFAIRYRIVGIPHYHPTDRFARYILREIEEQSEGEVQLTPQNCVVLCSTPTVIEMFQALGFAILPAELGATPPPLTPIELLKGIVAAGESWPTNRRIREQLSPATFDLWQDFPDIPRRILRLWGDPLLNDAGSLTDTRDYASYAYGMANRDIIELKYQDVRPVIVPGKIVDEGCADGALLTLVARDFPDSDLIGIEITGEFMARCREAQRAGFFGGTFVHFHQRNITQPIFQDNAIDSTLCNSTTHELWSYGQQAVTLHNYLAQKYAQTRRGGRLIIRDVVGPEEKEQLVWMWLNDEDGSNEQPLQEFDSGRELANHLNNLSTYSRFVRFAHDFLAEMRASGQRGPETQISYQEISQDGRRYISLTLRQAVEFMTKKDYSDNWQSEMHEEFAFWSFHEWKMALQAAGFTILEDPNSPQHGSRVYVNDWIVKNRWQGKVALFRPGNPTPLPYPVTNIILVGQK